MILRRLLLSIPILLGTSIIVFAILRLVPGDPAVSSIEKMLADQPQIRVPAISFDGGADGVSPAQDEEFHARHFGGPFTHRVLAGIGHNIPQEAPGDFADAVLDLQRAGK